MAARLAKDWHYAAQQKADPSLRIWNIGLAMTFAGGVRDDSIEFGFFLPTKCVWLFSEVVA